MTEKKNKKRKDKKGKKGKKPKTNAVSPEPGFVSTWILAPRYGMSCKMRTCVFATNFEPQSLGATFLRAIQTFLKKIE